tara:strand:+ start:25015 stop:25362 length:348 start_codon:yes stop_codon:yes gene_type:complete
MNYDMTVRQMYIGTVIDMLEFDIECMEDDQDEDHSDHIYQSSAILQLLRSGHQNNWMPAMNDLGIKLLAGLFRDDFENYEVQDIDDAETWGDKNGALTMFSAHYDFDGIDWEVEA